MVGLRPLRHPARFLGLFALLLAILLPVWDRLSACYLAGLVGVVNLLLRWADTPIPIRLAPGAVYPAVAGGIALLLATPALPARKRLSWLAALLGLLGLFHVGLLLLETRAAVAGVVPPRVLGPVKAWGTPVLVLLTWFAAVQPGRSRRRAATPSGP